MGRARWKLPAHAGTLLFVSHFGSFEVMRVGAVKAHALPLRIVLDMNVGRRFMAALGEVNPEIAAGVIDSSNRGVDLALRVREALAAGDVVGLMVDRTRGGERTVEVDFLGGRAKFPGESVAARRRAEGAGDASCSGYGVGGDRYAAYVRRVRAVDRPAASESRR